MQCPICRSRIRELSEPDPSAVAFKFSYAGVVFKAGLEPGETVRDRLEELLAFTPGTLRVIAKGGQRTLDLQDLLVQKEPDRKWVHKVHGTVMGKEVVPPQANLSMTARVASQLRYWGVLAFTAGKDLCAAVLLFFRTLNPLSSFVEDSERDEAEAERERHRRLHREID